MFLEEHPGRRGKLANAGATPGNVSEPTLVRGSSRALGVGGDGCVPLWVHLGQRPGSSEAGQRLSLEFGRLP